jgi:hypothetical protein
VPEAFTGDDDLWEPESPFPIWVLNEWIWLNNPNGMFTLLNPRVSMTEGHRDWRTVHRSTAKPPALVTVPRQTSVDRCNRQRGH